MKWLEKHPWDHSRRIDTSGQLFTANSNLWDSEMHGCNEMILPYIFIVIICIYTVDYGASMSMIDIFHPKMEYPPEVEDSPWTVTFPIGK